MMYGEEHTSLLEKHFYIFKPRSVTWLKRWVRAPGIQSASIFYPYTDHLKLPIKSLVCLLNNLKYVSLVILEEDQVDVIFKYELTASGWCIFLHCWFYSTPEKEKQINSPLDGSLSSQPPSPCISVGIYPVVHPAPLDPSPPASVPSISPFTSFSSAHHPASSLLSLMVLSYLSSQTVYRGVVVSYCKGRARYRLLVVAWMEEREGRKMKGEPDFPRNRTSVACVHVLHEISTLNLTMHIVVLLSPAANGKRQ